MRMKPSVKRKNIPTLGIPLSHWDGSPVNWNNIVGISIGQTHMHMYPSKTAIQDVVRFSAGVQALA